MLLGPLGGSEESPFLTIPQREYESAARLPTRFQQLAERPCRFEKSRRAARRIRCAIHPCVMMVAVDDPLVGEGNAIDAGDDVVQRPLLPVEHELQLHAGRPGTQVIGDRQRAPPVLRRDRPAKRLQQRQRIAVRDREHRDFQDCLRVGDRQLTAARLRSPPGRQRIARVNRHVDHTAPLNAELRSEGPSRIHVSLVIAVVTRVRIDQASHRTMFPGHFGFDAAPASPVTRDDDLALDAHAPLLETRVILGNTVVNIHELRRDIAVTGVRVEGWQLAGVAGVGIFRKSGLG